MTAPHRGCWAIIQILTHDDVSKWKHHPRYLAFVWGIHRSPMNSPHKGQWRGVLVFSLICAWINGWVNNRDAGDLKRHGAHYDVTVMPSYTADPSPLAQHPCIHNVTKTHLWSLLSVLNNAFTRIPGPRLNIKRSFHAWDSHYKDKAIWRSGQLIFIMVVLILVRWRLYIERPPVYNCDITWNCSSIASADSCVYFNCKAASDIILSFLIHCNGHLMT